jgi:hypothetical protein
MGTLHKGFVTATWLVLPAALYPEMARSDQAASTRLLKALRRISSLKNGPNIGSTSYQQK